MLGLLARKLGICFRYPSLSGLCLCKCLRQLFSVLVLLPYMVYFDIVLIHKYMYYTVAIINLSDASFVLRDLDN